MENIQSQDYFDTLILSHNIEEKTNISNENNDNFINEIDQILVELDEESDQELKKELKKEKNKKKKTKHNIYLDNQDLIIKEKIEKIFNSLK